MLPRKDERNHRCDEASNGAIAAAKRQARVGPLHHLLEPQADIARKIAPISFAASRGSERTLVPIKTEPKPRGRLVNASASAFVVYADDKGGIPPFRIVVARLPFREHGSKHSQLRVRWGAVSLSETLYDLAQLAGRDWFNMLGRGFHRRRRLLRSA